MLIPVWSGGGRGWRPLSCKPEMWFRCAIFRTLFITLIDSLKPRTYRMVCLWFVIWDLPAIANKKLYIAYGHFRSKTSTKIAWIKLNVPVNSKTRPFPSGQSPGIWPAFSSVQWEIGPKMRPARWGIWPSCQNVYQRAETKGFRNSLSQHVSHVQWSLLLLISRGIFCCCHFI